MTSIDLRDRSSFPVLPLGEGMPEEMYEPRRVVTVAFTRKTSTLAIEAASGHGRIAVIARQRDPDEQSPARADLYETGMLVEIENVERVGRQVNAMLRVLHPAQIVKTDIADIPDNRRNGPSHTFARSEAGPWRKLRHQRRRFDHLAAPAKAAITSTMR